MMTTVFVDFTDAKRPREIARDARDPFEQTADIERVARAYSERNRLVRVFADGPYVAPWRKRKSDPLYECRDGITTPEYR